MKKILYCNVGWMKYYQGSHPDDKKPIGGGGFNNKNIGHEVHNFLDMNGRCYGFVQIPENQTIKIDRYQGVSKEDDSVDDVLVIWVAKQKTIVGWYENATVYKEYHNLSTKDMKLRKLEGYKYYNISCFAKDATLLDSNERTFQIEDKFGRSNIWYGDNKTNKQVLDFISKYKKDLTKGSKKSYHVSKRISSLSKEDAIAVIEDIPTNIEGKEKEILTKARTNQSIFRDELLKKYKESCCLCKINHPKMLVASHIKPWSKSKGVEKLDVNNGLLLCANHDCLFDSGLISFDDNGSILISNELDKLDQDLTNTVSDLKIKMTKEMKKFMKYHREKIFKKNSNKMDEMSIEDICSCQKDSILEEIENDILQNSSTEGTFNILDSNTKKKFKIKWELHIPDDEGENILVENCYSDSFKRYLMEEVASIIKNGEQNSSQVIEDSDIINDFKDDIEKFTDDETEILVKYSVIITGPNGEDIDL